MKLASNTYHPPLAHVGYNGWNVGRPNYVHIIKVPIYKQGDSLLIPQFQKQLCTLPSLNSFHFFHRT